MSYYCRSYIYKALFISPTVVRCVQTKFCVCPPLVWIDRVPKQYALEVADLALSVRSGGRLGHQPQQPHLHVSYN